jgi:hypothetical protein
MSADDGRLPRQLLRAIDTKMTLARRGAMRSSTRLKRRDLVWAKKAQPNNNIETDRDRKGSRSCSVKTGSREAASDLLIADFGDGLDDLSEISDLARSGDLATCHVGQVPRRSRTGHAHAYAVQQVVPSLAVELGSDVRGSDHIRFDHAIRMLDRQARISTELPDRAANPIPVENSLPNPVSGYLARPRLHLVKAPVV